MINMLICTPTVTLFSTSMYQVLKEIKNITSDLGIKLYLFKIKAHQDDLRNSSNLIFVEREHVVCDLDAKALMYNAGSEIDPSLFDLSSRHFSTKHDHITSTPTSL